MPASDLPLLIDAARAAGRIASRHFRKAPRVWHKPGDAGPVTEADLEIDRMLSAELTAARPDYGWLSEESDDTAARQEHARVFIVDPIDGTRSFINGETIFAHSLAVAEGGRVTAGVVYLPERDLLFAATRDGGATLNAQPLRPARKDRLDGATVLAAKSNFDSDHWQGGILPCTRHFRASLAYRMCLVAEGRFDAMITLRDCWEWDIAAGDLIATEAGARVTDRRGAALCFNNPHPQCPGVLAAGAALHDALHARLLTRH